MRKTLLFAMLMSAALPAGAQRQTIVLGQSAVPLTGPWKFSPGDSSWLGAASDGDFLWAQPTFDDSAWASMDLTPPANSVDIQYGSASFLPGWTVRGYPHLHGYAWYRLRLCVQKTGQPLWLSMPMDVDDAYQVFANGQYIGQFGEFGPHSVRLHYGHPVTFQLPPSMPDGTIVIALRFFMSAVSALRWPQAGGPHGAPLLGTEPTVALQRTYDQDTLLLGQGDYICGTLLCLLALPGALWALFRNRRDRVWLWLTLALFCTAFADAAQSIGILGSQTLSMWWGEFWFLCVFTPALQLCWTLFWWHWFGLENRLWIRGSAILLALLYFIANFCFESPLLGFSFASQSLLHACEIAIVSVCSALGVLLLAILAEAFRKDRTAALAATLPVALQEVMLFYLPLLVIFHIGPAFYLGPLAIPYSSLAAISTIVIVGVLSVRRFLANRDREVVERESVARDLEQARQLQQGVLVVEPVRSGAYKINVAYHPAQTVGGDFFQTIANPDGTLLLVIGDVSGKGISAAMLVAVLVGGARARARQTSDPAAILAELNAQMIGRSGGHFATCLVAALSHDGNLRLANAGHLPPYRNGRELEMEGSLPLGMTEHLEPVIQIFRLDPDDTLTFLSDGVVEAQNQHGELFGFDRTRSISNQSAETIAQAAQAFGQEDDITVLTLNFAPSRGNHAQRNEFQSRSIDLPSRSPS
jgi:hypothetical protein